MNNHWTLLVIVVLALSLSALAQSAHDRNGSIVPAGDPWHDLRNGGDFGRLVPVISSDGTACSECAASCQYRVDECKAGQMSSCYRAAQCLCQCNLDAGGCGSSHEALQRCVDENKKFADEMER